MKSFSALTILQGFLCIFFLSGCGESSSSANTSTDSGTNNGTDSKTVTDDTSSQGTVGDSDSSTSNGSTDRSTDESTEGSTDSENKGGTDTGTQGGTDTGTAAGNIKLPTANASFDYQIGGAYTPPAGVTIVSRDRNDSPAAGIYNICYVNGFQVQPDEENWWKSNHEDLLLHDSSGNLIIDKDWEEYLLDTSTSAKRTALAAIVGDWMIGCKDDGFDAVEIDNLDSYSRSDGYLSKDNNVAFISLLSDIAHANGLAIGQKNSTELISRIDEMKTDFAVAEECNRYNECGDYKDGYGDLVFVIEYRTSDFTSGCSNFPELSIVLRNVAVSTPSSGKYVYDGC